MNIIKAVNILKILIHIIKIIKNNIIKNFNYYYHHSIIQIKNDEYIDIVDDDDLSDVNEMPDDNDDAN